VTYRYDGTTRRIVKLLGSDPENPDQRLDFYYSGRQVVETRKDGDEYEHFVWSQRYVHSPILRDRDADGQSWNGLEERLYYTNDANFNVTALIDTNGAVVERYTYDPYGKVTFHAADWGTRAESAYANDVLFTGHRLDTESGLYYFLMRYYHPTVGRLISWDPIGNAGGMNLVEYVGSCPIGRLDPYGLLDELLKRQLAETCARFMEHQFEEELKDLEAAEAIACERGDMASVRMIRSRKEQLRREIEAARLYGSESVERVKECAVTAIGVLAAGTGVAVAAEVGGGAAIYTTGSLVASGAQAIGVAGTVAAKEAAVAAEAAVARVATTGPGQVVLTQGPQFVTGFASAYAPGLLRPPGTAAQLGWMAGKAVQALIKAVP